MYLHYQLISPFQQPNDLSSLIITIVRCDGRKLKKDRLSKLSEATIYKGGKTRFQ